MVLEIDAHTRLTQMSTTVEVETEPVENLWSSILDSVSSTRSIPSKQVLILGEKSSGRSTLASGLLGRPLDTTSKDNADFALGYDWADVRDDADEGRWCLIGFEVNSANVAVNRYPGPSISLHSTFFVLLIFVFVASFLATANIYPAYPNSDSFGLDETLDIHGTTGAMAHLD